MKKTKPTLAGIRKGMTKFQKDLLQEIWQHFREKEEWPQLRTLYRNHGKKKVKEALSKLGPSVGWEESGPRRWSRYGLTLLGALLTEDGVVYQKLLARFFEFQRGLFQKEPEKEDSGSAQITNVLKLKPKETGLLG